MVSHKSHDLSLLFFSPTLDEFHCPVFKSADPFFHWSSPLFNLFNLSVHFWILQLCDFSSVLFEIYCLLVEILTLFMHFFLTSVTTFKTVVLNFQSGKPLTSISLRSVSEYLPYSFVWNILLFLFSLTLCVGSGNQIKHLPVLTEGSHVGDEFCHIRDKLGHSAQHKFIVGSQSFVTIQASSTLSGSE